MTTEPTHDLSRWLAANDRLVEVRQAVTNMRGMPSALAADAEDNATYVLAPLRALEDVPLPEQVKERGRETQAAAKKLAEDPTRANAEAWIVALNGLHHALVVHGKGMRSAIRTASSSKTPPEEGGPRSDRPQASVRAISANGGER